uniref:J domain-containing protein n=1 Tax=Meloidogyne hapla TaxID=6305 RepID=A0A1I8B7S3_MELHA
MINKSITNYYEKFNIPKKASEEVIKKLLKDLLLINHPDKNKNDLNATEITKELNAAKDILLDNEKRRRYDRELEGKKRKNESTNNKGSSQNRANSSSGTSYGQSNSKTYGTQWNNTNFGSSSQGRSSTFNFGRSYSSNFGTYTFFGSPGTFFYSTSGGCSSGGSSINSSENNVKIFIFSAKILVQNKNEVKETTALNINGATNKIKIYGNNIHIQHVISGHIDKIKAKSVRIELNSGSNVFSTTKNEYKFSEKFKKLKPTGHIKSINGATNIIEMHIENVQGYNNIKINGASNIIKIYGQ